MHGTIKVFGAIIIAFVAISLSILAVVWIVPQIEESIELNEIQVIRNQFEECNDKIMETARTGSTNKCFFSINKGQLTANTSNINYIITSKVGICDQHPWVQINEEKHLWQKCDVSDNNRIFEIMWNFSSYIIFQLNGISEKRLGNVIEISRVDVTEDTATLRLT